MHLSSTSQHCSRTRAASAAARSASRLRRTSASPGSSPHEMSAAMPDALAVPVATGTPNGTAISPG
eukprot:354974-Chlamydomonas_euryale.AAC.1